MSHGSHTRRTGSLTKGRVTYVVVSAWALLGSEEVSLAQTVVRPAERVSLGLTVYEGFAQIRDARRVNIPEGEALLVWTGVPATIDPGTIVLSADGRPLEVRALSFAADRLSQDALLRARIGDSVTLVGEGGERTPAILVSAEGPVFRAGDRLIVGWKGHIEVPVPPGEPTDPALPSAQGAGPREIRFRLAGAEGDETLTASYLADGLAWKADYVALSTEGAARMRLDGRVTVQNSTDSAFPDATLQLVAGEVHRGGGFQPPIPREELRVASEGAAFDRAPLADYHVYNLDQPLTIGALETSQLPLFPATDIDVRREYVLTGQQYYFHGPFPDSPGLERPRIRLRFDNDGLAGEGEPLPAGMLHTYVRDEAGRLQFTGEAPIPHMPAGELIEVVIGSAFDIVAERTQTDYQQLAPEVHESAWRIEIRNRGEEDRAVLVLESLPGDWEIVEESLPHERLDAQTAQWSVPVSAGSEAVLTYRVRARTL